MEEYIKKLLEQVRFKKAHKGIEDEIRAHIEDQISDNMAAGMDRESAEKAAVADMGDPVEVGISMDRVHKPHLAWSMVIAALVVGILGSIIHILITKDAVASGKEIFVNGSDNYILYTIFGIIAMILFYLIDYTNIAKYSKFIVAALLVQFMLVINDTLIVIGHEGIFASSLMLLMVPAYAGIIYKYRGDGFGALIKSLLWIIIPCGIVFIKFQKMPAVVMIISMLVQLTIAIVKGWIKVPKIPAIVSMWAFFTAIPVACLAIMYRFGLLAQYQMDRIRVMLKTDSEAYYTIKMVRDITKSASQSGKTSSEIIGVLPNPDSYYILTYILATWGDAVLIAVITVVAAVIVAGFVISSKAKNQLGIVMGSGCMMALAVNAIANMCAGFGVTPYFSSFFPFISSGGSNLLISYAFLGIVMSIYKYKAAYPQHVDIDIRGRIRLGKIEITKS
ncbi:permease prefix domain 1-containing protein [Butyrivibrio sp. INlla14]|uniref:permease prefix domain 1-containing protein n=1 Tax=Butyrivibrio sp. INlla14 TaxID=1520808 RepID=UPI0008766A86|nr:permease prefix domain 1-containing protein [Butyrivibrio sp. INlla14]SCY35848.1 cell division protein FtsW, lipid II flippase [Butyrivibrio sp. INlla14]